MLDITDRINGLVTNFVTEITRLAREAAVSTLTDVLTDGAQPRRLATSAPRVPRNTTPRRTTVRPQGAKRPKSEIAAIRERVHQHIAANPGQRIEQINKVLGTRTADLSLPLKKLIAEGAVATKGERRATTYYPGSGGAGRRAKRQRGE